MPQRWPVSLFSPKVSVILRVVNKPLDYAEMVYIKHLPYKHLQYAPPLEIWTQCYALCWCDFAIRSNPLMWSIYPHTSGFFHWQCMCLVWCIALAKSRGIILNEIMQTGVMMPTLSSPVEPSQWCHNELDGVSDHQPHNCLLNRLFRSKKMSKVLVTGLCAGNSPVTGEFPAQRASKAENVSIWWRHRANDCPCRHMRQCLHKDDYRFSINLMIPFCL